MKTTSPHPRAFRFTPLVLLSTLLPFSAFAGNAKPEEAQLVIKTDRPEAIYSVNESVTFNVAFVPPRSGETPKELAVKWELSRDGFEPKLTGTSALVDGTAQISGKLDRPGFLRCTVTGVLEGKPVTGLGGAAIDPLKITPKAVMPDDFDAFWASKKAALAQVPMDPKLTPVKSPTEGIEAFDVQLKCVGKIPVSGYFARPANAKPKSLPAILSVHGAGVRSSALNTAAQWAKQNMLSLDINAHGLPNGQPAKYYEDLRANEYMGYPQWGSHSREESYFLGMFLRVIRAIDFLTAQPEWDGRTVIVQGGSQGGAQALAAAGLDERVTFFVARVPAICDHYAAVTKDPAGWPRFIKLNAEGKPVDPRIVEAAAYFDGVNFMRRAKADGFFTVGFIDKTCLPTTVYAAYNTLQSKKAIYNDVLAGHTNTPEATAAAREAILKHVEEQNRKP